jgi:hypothetical protein
MQVYMNDRIFALPLYLYITFTYKALFIIHISIYVFMYLSSENFHAGFMRIYV